MWAIADYLLKNTLMALLFLPFSFRLGINLHTPKRFWWVSYGAEFAVLGLLRYASPDEYYLSVSILSFVSVPITLVIKTYYYGNEIRKLKIQGGLALVMSFINGLVGATLSFSFFYTFLVSFTGMLLIMPACFLVDEYLLNGLGFRLPHG
ncbi:sensor protein UhpB [Rodentibacter pneumotropicus]|uniref:Sensor protein UhpB n=1 Tax=Rodentibacter pneumotropicus TaxID=758 RepID=A0A448MSC9_9PAST|nr:sensor protein UhpB [Rodentibacter pneumotropicus]